MRTIDYAAVQHGYADAALWSSSCNGQAKHADPSRCRGEDCDAPLFHLNYGRCDFTANAIVTMGQEVGAFVNGCIDQRPDIFDGMDAEQIGHDFWLTRNGHGAGFWDRGLGERGDWLTAQCKPYGEADVYVGDDGSVHYS